MAMVDILVVWRMRYKVSDDVVAESYHPTKAAAARAGVVKVFNSLRDAVSPDMSGEEPSVMLARRAMSWADSDQYDRIIADFNQLSEDSDWSEVVELSDHRLEYESDIDLNEAMLLLRQELGDT